MQKIIKIGPIVSEKNNRTDTHTDRQGSNYRPIFVPKDRSKIGENEHNQYKVKKKLDKHEKTIRGIYFTSQFF